MLQDEKYLLDHVVDGRCLFPFAGYPIIAWTALCKINGLDREKTAVTFENCRVYHPTLLSQAGTSKAKTLLTIIASNEIAQQ